MQSPGRGFCVWGLSSRLSVLGFLFSVSGLLVFGLPDILTKVIKDVTDLEVYNTSLELLAPLYRLTILLPPDHRKVKYQANEAGEKIPPQIAEGFGKKHAPREFCRFLSMALGSSDEVITHLREIKIIARSYKRISQEDCDSLIEKYKVLSRKLNKLLSSWQKFN